MLAMKRPCCHLVLFAVPHGKQTAGEIHLSLKYTTLCLLYWFDLLSVGAAGVEWIQLETGLLCNLISDGTSAPVSGAQAIGEFL